MSSEGIPGVLLIMALAFLGALLLAVLGASYYYLTELIPSVRRSRAESRAESARKSEEWHRNWDQAEADLAELVRSWRRRNLSEEEMRKEYIAWCGEHPELRRRSFYEMGEWEYHYRHPSERHPLP